MMTGSTIILWKLIDYCWQPDLPRRKVVMNSTKSVRWLFGLFDMADIVGETLNVKASLLLMLLCQYAHRLIQQVDACLDIEKIHSHKN